jgi:LPS sulfotransferase NodH
MFQKLNDATRRRKIRCCTFHFGRCGSTVLGNLLNAHSQIEWQSELFHEFHERVAVVKNREEPIEHLENLIAVSPAPVFGFECKFQHLDSNGLDLAFEQFVDQLLILGFNRFIVLNRKNYLRQAISVARGQATRNWHLPIKQATPPTNRIYLNLHEIGLGGQNRSLLDCFRHLESQYATADNILSAKHCSLLNVCYEEDLQQDPLVGYRKTVDFLSMHQEQPVISLQQIGGKPIHSMVENFEEIQTTLRGTEFEWMLSV